MTGPFRFFECTLLIQPTGRKARDAGELLRGIEEAPQGVIYHHTHQYFLKAAVEVPEYPGDFAVWAAESLEERALAEKLAGVDLYASPDLESVREALKEVLRSYLQENPPPRPVRFGDEFFFNDVITLVADTGMTAENLGEFKEVLGRVGASSLYFHFYEARMRLRRPMDDFSAWLETSLGEKDLANRIRRLDPYQYSLEGLREELLFLLS